MSQVSSSVLSPLGVPVHQGARRGDRRAHRHEARVLPRRPGRQARRRVHEDAHPAPGIHRPVGAARGHALQRLQLHLTERRPHHARALRDLHPARVGEQRPAVGFGDD